MEYNDILNDEKVSAIKAQRGIETMEVLYSQLQENEGQEEEKEEKKEEDKGEEKEEGGEKEENNGNENEN